MGRKSLKMLAFVLVLAGLIFIAVCGVARQGHTQPAKDIRWPTADNGDDFCRIRGSNQKLRVKRLERPLPATAISNIGGFIGGRLQANIDGYLHRFDIERYVRMTEEKKFREWRWLGEQSGKWLEGAILASEQSGDKVLREKAKRVLARLVAAQESSGYLGITDPAVRTDKMPLRGMDAYELYWMIHALLTAHEVWQDEAALSAAKRLGDYFVDKIGPGKAEFWPGPKGKTIAGHECHYGLEGTLLTDPMLRLYEISGDQKYLNWSRWAVNNIDRWSGYETFSKFDKVAEGVIGLHDTLPEGNIHAHTIQMNFLAWLRLHQITGDESLFNKVRAAWDDIAARQMYITGGTSYRERYWPERKLPPQGEVVETCSQLSWIRVSQYLLELTGDPKYADAIERLLFNHLFAAQTIDGDSCTYFTELNGVKPVDFYPEGRRDPGCCTSGFPLNAAMVPSLIYATGEDGVYINQFITSEALIRLESDNTVTVSQKTGYPAGEKMAIHIRPQNAEEFTTHLRLPAWCESPSVTVNGQAVGPLKPGAYAVIRRKWVDGDQIKLTLPMQLRWIKGARDTEGMWALMRGPVVYMLDTVWWDEQSYKALGEIPNNLADVVSLNIDPEHPAAGLGKAEAPAGRLGPAYALKLTLANGWQGHAILLPFANLGKWYRTEADKRDKFAKRYPYAVWLRGSSDKQGKALAGALSGLSSSAAMEWVQVAGDKQGFVLAPSGRRFVAWGFNYDRDYAGRLLEDYWHQEWPTVAEDFKEMKALGANVVRIHLQLARFMEAPQEPNQAALERLARLVALAEERELYLDITGLGCYDSNDVPEWYDAMGEARRWDVQALFWEAVAKTCRESPAVFCYDLMNEPILPGENEPQTEWLLGEVAGKHYVQRITLDLGRRTREQVAKAWVEKLVAAIRKHDDRHLVTVGVIPWVHSFPQAKPLFYSKQVGGNLDFASVHFYPKRGEVDKALAALAAYDIGKPLVVEEMGPLYCGPEELAVFIEASRKTADGWLGFYWGKTIEEYRRSPKIGDKLMVACLELFQNEGKEVYLFSSFRGEREGLYLAYSEDLYNWTEIPGPHLKPTIGDNVMRDPFIMMGPDGTIHMVWTTGWGRRDIGYANTRDLVNWSEPRLIPLMESKPSTKNCWAPKMFYDGQKQQWQIVWSSWVDDGTFPPPELPHTSKQHRVWYVTTKDFESFTEPKVLLEPGYSCIDAYLIEGDGEYLLFFKDERYNDSDFVTAAHQNIRMARSKSRYGPFGDISEPITGQGPGKWHNEGPCAVKHQGEYYVFYDHHSGQTYYGAIRSKDLKNWTDVSDKMNFPKGLKHGSIIKVPKRIVRPLLEKTQKKEKAK